MALPSRTPNLGSASALPSTHRASPRGHGSRRRGGVRRAEGISAGYRYLAQPAPSRPRPAASRGAPAAAAPRPQPTSRLRAGFSHGARPLRAGGSSPPPTPGHCPGVPARPRLPHPSAWQLRGGRRPPLWDPPAAAGCGPPSAAGRVTCPRAPAPTASASPRGARASARPDPTRPADRAGVAAAAPTWQRVRSTPRPAGAGAQLRHGRGGGGAGQDGRAALAEAAQRRPLLPDPRCAGGGGAEAEAEEARSRPPGPRTARHPMARERRAHGGAGRGGGGRGEGRGRAAIGRGAGTAP